MVAAFCRRLRSSAVVIFGLLIRRLLVRVQPGEFTEKPCKRGGFGVCGKLATGTRFLPGFYPFFLRSAEHRRLGFLGGAGEKHLRSVDVALCDRPLRMAGRSLAARNASSGFHMPSGRAVLNIAGRPASGPGVRGRSGSRARAGVSVIIRAYAGSDRETSDPSSATVTWVTGSRKRAWAVSPLSSSNHRA